ncbi:MAG: hypothetical protein DLM59_06110 [Pseudonocardiales bacterium]|nr:MAG: hypothetical protein DLM59_06110 [Pseudonocardiales bacterium]
MIWHRRLARVLARLREFHATQLELHDRLLLADRPWEEDFLHWACDGQDWHLHGHLSPPPDGRRHSTTPAGWCPACRRTAAQDRETPPHREDG